MPTLDRVCFGCGLLIDDPYYLMLIDHSWHLSCLKCSHCRISLEQENKCFIQNGKIFCKEDCFKRNCLYICARCNKIIKENEIIHRIEQMIYHIECLTCVICNENLHSGDEFGLKNSLIYCRHHYFDQEYYHSDRILDDSGYYTSPNETRQSKQIEDYLTTSPIYSIEKDPNNYYALNKSNHSKQKRLRTSFKHQQLRYMRSYFNLNHNPDAKELKTLSEKTSLSKRVLQVWFQNARAKYRRNNTLSKEDRFNYDHQLEHSMSPS